MYECYCCGKRFSNPATYKERYVFSSGPYVTIETCPYCGIDEFERITDDEESMGSEQ